MNSSGIIGTGQFSKSGIISKNHAGSNAFAARVNANSWASYSSEKIPINTYSPYSTHKLFNDGPSTALNTSTYEYTIPATGIWELGIHVYTAYLDATHTFQIRAGGSEINFGDGAWFVLDQSDVDDKTLDLVGMAKFTAGTVLDWYSSGTTDWHSGMSHVWGYQIS